MNDKYKIEIQEFKRANSERKVVILGVGSLTKIIINQLKCPIYMFVDNDARKQGLKVADIIGDSAIESGMIVNDSTRLMRKSDADALAVIVAGYHYEEIKSQLNAMGIYNVYDGLTFIPDDICEKCEKNIENNLIIQNNKVCVMMGNYGGHGQYITNALLKLDRNIDIVWLLKNPRKDVPLGVRTVLDGNVEDVLKELNTAKVWIYDVLVPLYVNKKTEQIYIQVKHWGSVTLKEFYFDDHRHENEKNIRKMEQNADMMDYILSGSRFDEESCKTGFHFRGEFVRVGSPRTDAMFEESNKEKVCRYYGIDIHKKLALYVPTFSDNPQYTDSLEKLDLKLVREKLAEKMGGEWVVLVRLHPHDAMKHDIESVDDGFVDACFYENSQELCSASDVVITNYSSIMFEPAYVNKPVFLFAPDVDEYINGDRGFLLDYDSLPFSIAHSNEEMMANILNFDADEYREKLEEFCCKYEVREDGHASERAARFIAGLLEENPDE